MQESDEIAVDWKILTARHRLDVLWALIRDQRRHLDRNRWPLRHTCGR
ncbi:hypothetical protein [Streptomyces sp. NBC_01363]|nr:hypothetical protein [Streptomyces sp. NBC_01363]MCX4733925.1 hypothetical protein [Streptomyces sp. NBC_01363]